MAKRQHALASEKVTILYNKYLKKVAETPPAPATTEA